MVRVQVVDSVQDPPESPAYRYEAYDNTKDGYLPESGTTQVCTKTHFTDKGRPGWWQAENVSNCREPKLGKSATALVPQWCSSATSRTRRK